MITVTDQLGRMVSIAEFPAKIISIVPSQTELLFHLGLDSQVAGITRFCTHPADKVVNKLKIGGTKQLNIPLICSLKPNLIIANKEENERLQLEGLMAGYPTYVSDPSSLAGALQMINDVGTLVGRKQEAVNLINNIQKQFKHLNNLQLSPLRVAYLIWKKPYMVAGKNTFIDDMLCQCGFENVFKQQRYPAVTMDMLVDARPDVILLSSEPYPFKPVHMHEFAITLPDAVVKLVDGELFSWYGSRLLHAPGYFITLTDSIKQAINRK